MAVYHEIKLDKETIRAYLMDLVLNRYVEDRPK